MAKIMDPILPILCILGYWAMILGSFGGPGTSATLPPEDSEGKDPTICAQKERRIKDVLVCMGLPHG